MSLAEMSLAKIALAKLLSSGASSWPGYICLASSKTVMPDTELKRN